MDISVVTKDNVNTIRIKRLFAVHKICMQKV